MLASTTFTIALGLVTAALTVNAKCCKPHWNNNGDKICDDGKVHDGLCCGVGSCNFFCCACDNADCWGPDRKLTGRASTFDAFADIAASRAMFASVNVANNGAISLDEYLGWANSTYGEGKVGEATAYFHQFDANSDGFVSFDEMHVATK